MKTCRSCEKEKPLSEFNRRGEKHQSKCKVCSRAYGKQHYSSNRKYYIDKAGRRTELYRAELRKYIFEFLSKNPCACGEDDPIVLDFDHDDKDSKVLAISDMVRRGWSLNSIKTEINKCTVRCANCHRRRTAEQFDWWMVRYAPVSPLASDQSLKA